MNKSYIVVFDISNITKATFKSGLLTWSGNIETYMYSVKLDEEKQALLWDSWIDKNTNPSEKEEKKNKFDKIPFKVSYEAKSLNVVEAATGAAMYNLFSEMMYTNSDGIKYKGDGIAEFKDFANRAFKTGMHAMEKLNSDFKVKTAITETFPVRAKIGKKEDLKARQLYEVFQGTYNSKTDKITSKKIGYIRATSIANNNQYASGNSSSSKFSIIQKSKKITPYMYIQQKNDQMLSFYVDYIHSENLKQASTGISYLTFITTNSLYGNLLLDMSFTGNNLIATDYDYYSGYTTSVEPNVSICFRIGYAMGFNIPLSPNFKAEVFATVGIGFSSYTPSVETEEGDAAFNEAIVSYGGKLIYNVWYPLQAYLKYENVSLGSSSGALNAVGVGLQVNF